MLEPSIVKDEEVESSLDCQTIIKQKIFKQKTCLIINL